jgi:hypothetical protein
MELPKKSALPRDRNPTSYREPVYLKKNVLHNRLFESLDEIEDSLQIFLDGLQNHTIAQLCNNNYLDI